MGTWIPQSAMRALEATIATTFSCREIRVEPFRAKLELEYYYLVEFLGDGPHSLAGVQTALQHAVVGALSGCDEADRPMFAVSLGPSHFFAADGKKDSVVASF